MKSRIGAKEPTHLQLVSVEVSGDEESFATHNNAPLPIEQTFGNCGGETTHQMALSIDDLNKQ